jgi:hypothetical protein
VKHPDHPSHFPEKRQYIRLASVFPIEFRVITPENVSGSGPWQQGYTCNVSEGGICLETVCLDAVTVRGLQRSDACLELSLRIPLTKPAVKARAGVMWVRKVEGAAAAHYLMGLKFVSIAPSDAERIVSHARWFRFSARGVFLLVLVLFLAFMVSSFYGYHVRRTNEKLVDRLVDAQQEETLTVQIIEEIEREKQMLSLQMKKYSEGIREGKELKSEYEELVERENRIADRLALLERQKTGIQRTLFNKMHQWLKNHQNPETGLILSFEGNVGVVKDWAFIYDQALAANVFLLFHNERDARRILNFFQTKMTEDFQGFPNAYYYDSGEISEFTVHCGPNIWVGIAVMQYIQRTKDAYYLPLARGIADWLITIQDSDPAGGLKGGPKFSWFATEHNLDAYAFLGMVYEKTQDEKYKIARKKILSWLKTFAMIPHAEDYASPPVNRGRGDATIATDTFAWSLAALGPRRLSRIGMDPEEIMRFAEENCGAVVHFERPSGVVVEVEGFDFAKTAHMPRGGMVSPEWTSQMIVSYQILSRYFSGRHSSSKADYYAEKARIYLNELNKLVISSPSAKGQGEGCLPYATLEDADTGHGWSTPPGTKTCSVAGTAYMIMAMRQFNPLVLTGEPD